MTITIVFTLIVSSIYSIDSADVRRDNTLKVLKIANLTGSWAAQYSSEKGHNCYGIEIGISKNKTNYVIIFGKGNYAKNFTFTQKDNAYEGILSRNIRGLPKNSSHVLDTDYLKYLLIYNEAFDSNSSDCWTVYSKTSDNHENGQHIEENTLKALHLKLENFGAKPTSGQNLLNVVTHENCKDRSVVPPGGIVDFFSRNSDVE